MTEGSDKETRHIELSLKASGLDYLPGDSLGVLPTNCEDVVNDLLETVALTGKETHCCRRRNCFIERRVNESLCLHGIK